MALMWASLRVPRSRRLLTNLAGDFDCQLFVPFRVYLRDVGGSVAKGYLCGFESELFADVGATSVTQLIR